MSVEGMSSVSSSYQGQGSSVSASTSRPVASVSESKPVETTTKQDLEITSAVGGDTTEKNNVREEGQASNEQIRKAVDKINKEASGNGEVVFGIHDETNRVTIKIVDKDTKKVIKEFPPEKTLDMIARVWEMAGIMVDEKR